MISTLSVLLALVTIPVSVQAKDDVEVSTLAREDYLWVSVELPDAYSAAVREAVETGLETTFNFDVESDERSRTGRTRRSIGRRSPRACRSTD